MRLAVTLIGTIAILVGVVLAFVPLMAGGGGVATATTPLVIQVPAGIGPVPVNIAWSDLALNSQIHLAYCPAGTLPLTQACPRFNLVSSANDTYGSLNANVPAGMQVVVVVTGPAGASSGAVVSAADPTVGVIVIGIGGALVGVGVWLKGRPSPPAEEPRPGQRLASDRSSGTPSAAPRSSKGRL
ncbi:MAG: hypothetical protein WB788_06850 [Thermoplasmata archaeon]